MQENEGSKDEPTRMHELVLPRESGEKVGRFSAVW